MKKIIMKDSSLTVLIWVLILSMFWPAMLLAQQSETTEPALKNSVVVYLLAPTIEGKVGVGRIESELEIDPGDVFDALDGAFLASYVVEKGNWGALVDLIYMDLSSDITADRGLLSGEVDLKQTTLGVYGAYRLNGNLQLLFGGRYVDLTNKIALNLSSTPSFKVNESWIDPVIGLRSAGPLSDRWSYGLVGDIGGFGIGSDFSWQLTGSFSFRMTEHTLLSLGYRYIGFDYEDGQGRDAFKFDVKEHGPALGLCFEF